MQYLHRNDVALAYEEAGSGAPPILLVHGFCGNHTQLAPQFDHFRQRHRVVSVDRRGHGASDKPVGDYSIASYAEDLAWLSGELGLYKPAVVVHSQGRIALELAARYPGLLSAIVLLDAPLLPPEPMREAFRGLLQGLRGDGYQEALGQFIGSAFLPTDDPTHKAAILEDIVTVPRHVVVSSWEGFVAHDEAAAAARCEVPVLLIQSIFPSDVDRFSALCPRLVVEQITGAGHFVQLEKPEQVNLKIDRFLDQVAVAEGKVATNA